MHNQVDILWRTASENLLLKHYLLGPYQQSRVHLLDKEKHLLDKEKHLLDKEKFDDIFQTEEAANVPNWHWMISRQFWKRTMKCKYWMDARGFGEAFEREMASTSISSLYSTKSGEKHG
ncbi:unnamed protein product [Calypogeia fissa]